MTNLCSLDSKTSNVCNEISLSMYRCDLWDCALLQFALLGLQRGEPPSRMCTAKYHIMFAVQAFCRQQEAAMDATLAAAAEVDEMYDLLAFYGGQAVAANDQVR